MSRTQCAVCERFIRTDEKRYQYHETDDGNHRLGGSVNFIANRKDGALSHVCKKCYKANNFKVCGEWQILAEVEIRGLVWFYPLLCCSRMDFMSRRVPMCFPLISSFRYFVLTFVVRDRSSQQEDDRSRSFSHQTVAFSWSSWVGIAEAPPALGWLTERWLSRVQGQICRHGLLHAWRCLQGAVPLSQWASLELELVWLHLYFIAYLVPFLRL